MSRHYLMTEKQGTSFLEEVEGPSFSSTDVDGWEGLTVEAAGVFFFMFRIAPNAVEFPMHAAPDEYLGYVVRGSGKLHAGTEQEKLESVDFNEGDFITFKPDTMPGWTNGPQESKILFVRKLGS